VSKWTKELVIQDAKNYASSTDWYTNGKASYTAASKNGWLSEISKNFPKKIKPANYWTRERVLADAKKYKSRSEWAKSSKAAYTVAKRRGWYDTAVTHMELLVQHGKWTKEAVYESSRNFTHISEWQTAHPGAYGKALKMNWLEEIKKNMSPAPRKAKWTKELVLEDAKNYSTRAEWHKARGNAAHVAIKNGWHEEATRHMHRVYSMGELVIYKLLTQMDIGFQPQRRFDEIRSKKPLPYDFFLPEFNLVIEYQGVQHFQESSRKFGEYLSERQARDKLKREGAERLNLNYLAIEKSGAKEIEKVLLFHLAELASKLDLKMDFAKRALTVQEEDSLKWLGTVTKAEALDDAKQYRSYPEWRKNSSLYQIAIKNGWLAECKAHMIPEREARSIAKLKWTKEKAAEVAKKYKSRSEFKKANSSAYTRARINGWLEDICSHMSLKVHPNGYWTKERVISSAKQYMTRTDWMRSCDSAAYNLAREKGWMEEACSHMKWLSTKPNPAVS
jgi:hypothetical protein